MPRLGSATCHGNALSPRIEHAIDGDHHVASLLFEALSELFAPVSSASGRDVPYATDQKGKERALDAAAPRLLKSLWDVMLNPPTGGRGMVQLIVGDENLTLAEGHAGVEIMDQSYGDRRTIPVLNFEVFVHGLAEQIDKHADRYDEESVGLAREINAHTLLGIAPEMRRAITDFVDPESSAKLLCTSPLAGEDVKVKARAMEFIGPTLMKREGLHGLSMALARIAALPSSYQLPPLRALANAIPSLPVADQLTASNAASGAMELIALHALSDAACSLSPSDECALLATMVPVAHSFSVAHREPAWRLCSERVWSIRQIEPGERRSALIALAVSYVHCLSGGDDKQRAFERIRLAVKQLDAKDPSKGHTLLNLVDTIDYLPIAYQQASFDAILPDVVGLDDVNPVKESALQALAQRQGVVAP